MKNPTFKQSSAAPTARGWRSRIAAFSVVCLGTTLTVTAARAHGDPSQRIKFNDASAWELDRSSGRTRHVNLPTKLTGKPLSVKGNQVSIEQGPAGVVVIDRGSQTLRLLDDRELRISSKETKVPDAIDVRVGRSNVLVVEREAGRVFWFDAMALATGVDLATFPPLLQVEGQLIGELGVDDSVHVLVPATGDLISFDSAGRQRTKINLGKRSPLGQVQLSAVGSSPVVLDTTSRTLFVGGKGVRKIPLSRSQLQLAMPSAFSDFVVVSGEEAGGSILSISYKGEIKPLVQNIGANLVRPLVESDGCVSAASNQARSESILCPGAGSQTKGFGTQSSIADFQGRLVRDQPFFDDLNSDQAIFRLASRELAVTDSLAPDEQQADKKGDDGKKSASEANGDAAQGENKPPDAKDDEFKVRPNRISFLNVTANDSDPNGDVLTVTGVDGLGQGINATMTSGGLGVAFRPDPGFVGATNFRVTISDPAGENSISSVHVVVTNDGNGPPSAVDDVANGVPGSATLVDVTANDADPDGDSMSVTEATLASGAGEVKISQSAIVSFVPSSVGEAKIIYRVQDELGLSNEGTLIVQSTAVDNLAPIARDDVFDLQIGHTSTLDLLANDLDPDGGQLRLTEVPKSINPIGSLERDGNLIRLNPVQQGEQSFSYSVSDGIATVQAKVRVRVRAQVQNRPPIALPDRVNVEPGGFAIVNVTANDSDPDGDVVGVTSFTAPEGVEVDSRDGKNLLVKVPAGATSPSVVVYVLADGSTDVQGTLLVSPVVKPANLAPVAVDDFIGARQGVSRKIRVLNNDADPEGGRLRVSALLTAPPGVRIDEQTSEVLIEPVALVGDLSFEYEVIDTAGLKDTAKVSVNVITDSNSNQPPNARADSVTVRAGDAVVIPVRANDTDNDGDDFIVVSPGLPAKGTVTVVDGSIRYDANPGALGTDRFMYVIEDSHGGTAQAEVTVGVLPSPKANRAPVAVNDGPIRVVAGQSVDIAVLDNDSDPDKDDSISIASVAQPSAPSQGQATLTRNGLTYVAPGAAGAVTFTYTIVDRSGATAIGTVSVKVSAPTKVGIKPIAHRDTTDPISSGSTVDVKVLDNDEDPDGDPLTLVVVNATGAGANVAPDGKSVRIVGTGRAGTFNYVVRDQQGNTATGSISVPDGSARLLVARDDADVVASGGTIDIDVLANDSVSATNAPLRVIQVGSSDGGTATIVNASKVRFTANGGFAGLATFGYTVTDKTGKSANANVRVTVKVGKTVNRPPVVRAGGPLELLPGKSQTIDLAPLATDPEKARLKFALGDVPPQVKAKLKGTQVTITAPKAGGVWSGGVPFSATDPAGASATNEIIIRILTTPTTVKTPSTGASVPPTVGGVETTVAPAAGSPTPQPQTPQSQTPKTPPAGTKPEQGKTVSTAAPGTAGQRPGVTTEPDKPSLVTVTTKVTTSPGTSTGTTSTSSSTSTSTTKPGASSAVPRVPGAPANPTVGSPSVSSLTISWVAPTDLGVPTVSEYRVTASTGETRSAGTSISLTWTGLPAATTISFSVTACNTKGCGPTATSSEATTLPSGTVQRLPGTPGGVSAGSATVSSLTVSWAPPTDLGVPPVSEYRVTVNTGETRSASTATSLVWSGLAAGVSVSFTVVACNSKGCSSSSTAANGTTTGGSAGPWALTLPFVCDGNVHRLGSVAGFAANESVVFTSAPTIATLSPNNADASGVVQIDWACGGAGSYQLTATGSKSGRTTTTTVTEITKPIVWSLALPFVCDGTVHRLGSVSGFAANESVVFTSVPNIATLSPNNADASGVVQIDWACGGAGSYQLTATGSKSGRSSTTTVTERGGPAGPWSLTLPFVCNGTVHRLGSVAGFAANESVVFTSAPTIATLSPNNADASGVVQIDWACGGAGPYQLTATGSKSGRTTTTTVTESQPVPLTVTNLAVTAPTQTSLTLSWIAPASQGTAAISDYKVTITPGGTTKSAGTSPSVVWTGLTAGTTYSFTVAACNASGCGASSSPASGTTSAAIERPGQVAAPAIAAIDTTQLSVSWSAPSIGSGPITSYNVRLNSGQTVSAGGAPYTWSGLAPSTTYAFDVQACSAVGCGPWSPQAQGRTPDPVPSPSVTATRGAQYIIPVQCTHASCSLINVSIANMSGPYSIECLTDGGAFVYSYSTANANSAVCVWGFPGRQPQVRVTGSGGVVVTVSASGW
jgi:large repetitive protein